MSFLDLHQQPFPERQAYPGEQAARAARELPDPRFGCWFCGTQAIAIAPRHSGGDVDVPAHWLPVCQRHRDQWQNETDAAEIMPILPIGEIPS